MHGFFFSGANGEEEREQMFFPGMRLPSGGGVLPVEQGLRALSGGKPQGVLQPGVETL